MSSICCQAAQPSVPCTSSRKPVASVTTGALATAKVWNGVPVPVPTISWFTGTACTTVAALSPTQVSRPVVWSLTASAASTDVVEAALAPPRHPQPPAHPQPPVHPLPPLLPLPVPLPAVPVVLVVLVVL